MLYTLILTDIIDSQKAIFMGCTDQESNFQRETFHDGRWLSSRGYTPSYEGPLEEIMKRFPGYAKPRFLEGDNVYSAEENDDGIAIVKLIGKVTLNSVAI